MEGRNSRHPDHPNFDRFEDGPENWKTAKVTFFFKTGWRDKPNMSTSEVGKVLETGTRDRNSNHLDVGVMRESQHGCVKGKSCITNCLEGFFPNYLSRPTREI